MLVVIILTALIVSIVLIASILIYLITVIYLASDDSNSIDQLTLEGHPLPGISPEPFLSQEAICTNIDHVHTDDSFRQFKDTTTQNTKESEEASSRGQKSESKSILSKSIERLFSINGKKEEKNLNAKEPVKNNSQTDLGQSSARKSTQKQATVKELFDDFDQKEVQLGGTGLHWCKLRKSLDKLIKLGIPLNTLNSRHESALHVAIRRRKLQVLIGLLCHGADLECRNDYGETPLMLACKVNDIFACQILLVFDAKLNVRDYRGFTARHYAASLCHRHKIDEQQLPIASHLILAMLHEMGAKRCKEGQFKQSTLSIDSKTSIQFANCTEGCQESGSYNGFSYNRWPNLSNESFYKRNMFEDLINSLIEQKRENTKTGEGSTGNQKSRILSIDGGGMRGVIVCQTMIELEKHLKRPLIDYFDWVGGTSVGAFIACALCLKIQLPNLRRICSDVKDEVFSGKKPYNSSFLEKVLKRTFGSTTKMSDIKDKKLAVTTVVADREPCQLLFFRNYKSTGEILDSHNFPAEKFDAISGKPETENNSNKDELAVQQHQQQQMLNENERDPIIWQAVRASAAAPFFFKPYGPYLDGGIISNNPTMDIMTEFFSQERVKKFLNSKFKDKTSADEVKLCPLNDLKLVVSFGTGRTKVVSRQSIIDFSNITAGISSVFQPAELVRSIRALRDLFKKMMQQSCQTEDHILDRAQAWCSSLEISYFRINPPLANIFSIDDKRDEQVINALWQTKLYMKSMKKQVKQLAALLDGDAASDEKKPLDLM